MAEIPTYLHLYQTKQAHDADYNGSSYEEPWVAYVRATEEVSYNKPHDYSLEYLTFTALESGTFTLTIPSGVDTSYLESVSYSTDGGQNWTTTQNGSTNITVTTPTINAGEKVLWKGIGVSMANSSTHSTFSSTVDYKVSGNVMSLLYGDNFSSASSFSVGSTYNFTYLFGDSIHLVMASDLILPATTLASRCYRYMFYRCTSLVSAPALPSTTLAESCYGGMFQGCTSLTSAPALPAAALADYCYQNMFYGCTSLASAPALASTVLAESCYGYMFRDCTSLVSAPALPATTLVSRCYESMFYGCTSLTSAPALPATTLVYYCYGQMFTGCTSLASAPALPATALADYCYQSMFYGCTSLVSAPALPATTLTQSCYSGMFEGCTSLASAPALPATALMSSCYGSMFSGCSKLAYIKAMFTTRPSSAYTYNWVNGVAATGTFVKNSAATWNVTGKNGVPSGWTVETASE